MTTFSYLKEDVSFISTEEAKSRCAPTCAQAHTCNIC